MSAPLGNGRIALTNRRILLLCSSDCMTTTLTAERVKNVMPTKYIVTSSYADHRFYFPINISALVHLKFSMHSEYKAVGSADSAEECCCCCKQSNWWASKKVQTQLPDSTRTLLLAVHLPPWSNPCDMVLQMKPTMTLEPMKQFVVSLQGLMYGVMATAE